MNTVEIQKFIDRAHAEGVLLRFSLSGLSFRKKGLVTYAIAWSALHCLSLEDIMDKVKAYARGELA